MNQAMRLGILGVLGSLLVLFGADGAMDPQQSAILISFYNSLDSTGTLNWNTTIDLCTFNATIVCDSSSPANVIQLQIPGKSIKGTIPTQFGQLVYLQQLNMEINSFYGTIPTEMGLLSNLRSWKFPGNALNGTFPEQLWNLTGLQILTFDSNQISGTLSTNIGNMISLQQLSMDYNRFYSTIPTQIGEMRNLTLLSLYANIFFGYIPNQITNLSKLSELFLGLNELTGTIPKGLQNLTFGTLDLVGIPPANNFCPFFDYSTWNLNNDFPGSTSCQFCVSFSCQNFGTCVPGPNQAQDGMYSCICVNGTWGQFCQFGTPIWPPTSAPTLASTPSPNAQGSPTQPQQSNSLPTWVIPLAVSLGVLLLISIAVITFFFYSKKKRPENAERKMRKLEVQTSSGSSANMMLSKKPSTQF